MKLSQLCILLLVLAGGGRTQDNVEYGDEYDQSVLEEIIYPLDHSAVGLEKKDALGEFTEATKQNLNLRLQELRGKELQTLRSERSNRDGSTENISIDTGHLLKIPKQLLRLESGAQKLAKENLIRQKQDDLDTKEAKSNYATLQTDDGPCVIMLSNKSIDLFRHRVYYSQSTYVYLNLKPEKGSGINITGTKYIVGANWWIWTFYGKEGSLEFLYWPEEFGIWSLGLLYNSVIRNPITIYLQRVRGNCSKLEVGNVTDDLTISKALKYLTIEMMQFDEEKYAPGFYCYKKRSYIPNRNVYILCKHIVCPIEALEHACCWYYFDKKDGKRKIFCGNQQFKYDILWWAMPSLISMVLFVYSPIALMYIASKCSGKHRGVLELETQTLRNVVNNDEHRCAEHGEGNLESGGTSHCVATNSSYQTCESGPSSCKKERDTTVILLAGYQHVTLKNTLMSPFMMCCRKSKEANITCVGGVVRRLLRAMLPIVSLTIIGLQILMDNYFLYDFVLECMKKGVPMGFRSMLGGYILSKDNFLPYLGGPFMAVGVYLLITSLLLIIPQSPVKLVARSLKSKSAEVTPLSLRIRTTAALGSVRILRQCPYSQLYHLMLAQFYMLLNTRFWKKCFSILTQRWTYFRFPAIVFPFYIIVCSVELILASVIYAFPMISFGYWIIAGYTKGITWRHPRGIFFKLLNAVMSIVLLCSVLFSLLMFCTIFLDASLFVTRIIIFTFTGVIVYPKTAYGYLIFGFTVFYYLWQSVGDFTTLYSRLFRDTVQAAGMVQRANDRERILYKIKGETGIPQSLFEFVIEVHQPRRKQVFLSFLKAAIVLSVLWMLIHLLLTTDNFRELHVIMHVGTALFICAVPQMVKVVCKGKENRRCEKRFRMELADTVRVYMGYFVDDEQGISDSD